MAGCGVDTIGGRPASLSTFFGAMIFFTTRLVPADVTPPVSAAWNVQAPYFGYARMPNARVPGDTVDIIAALQWVTMLAGESGIERMLVGDPMPPGVEFGGARLWMIGRNATVTGTVRPWIGMRVFDSTGTILRATPLPVGEYGNLTNCNANGTRLWAGDAVGGPVLGSYLTQDGDRPVIEVGYSAVTNATANSIFGSIALVAGNEYALHVMSTAAQGVNPGSRAPYIEIIGATTP